MNLKILLSHKRTLIGAGLVLVVLLVIMGFLSRSGTGQTAFRTVPVRRGDLMATISATGTVEPEEVVDVGAQVAGKIVAFGKDKNGKTVDYGSVVAKGTVLARIDDSLYAADVASAKSQLAQNQAGVKYADANLLQLKAKLYQAQRDWARARKLGPSDALSQADYDAAQSAYEIARANVEVGKAAIVQAKDAVSQSKAALRRAQQNLDYCTIVSPVKGVIIDRRVNIGQTVVSSLSAPSLFLIAKDLTRIQVWVSVNEADIGHIHPGQPVTFTVDAFPDEEFHGEVGKVRLNATMTQNVVTYTVEVNTDNSDGKLLPYLTANVKFIVGDQKNAFLVPNASLRWLPEQNQVLEKYRRSSRQEKKKGASASEGSPAAAAGQDKRLGLVWVPEESQVRPIEVKVGLSDGSLTAVKGKGLKSGLPVVVGEVLQQADKGKGGSSPFTPHFFHRSANKPGK